MENIKFVKCNVYKSILVLLCGIPQVHDYYNDNIVKIYLSISSLLTVVEFSRFLAKCIF